MRFQPISTDQSFCFSCQQEGRKSGGRLCYPSLKVPSLQGAEYSMNFDVKIKDPELCTTPICSSVLRACLMGLKLHGHLNVIQMEQKHDAVAWPAVD